MPEGKTRAKKRNNVVSVPFDAAFYFERGLRSFHRNEMTKALRYFQQCVALDGRNPKYITHLAALHTEVGNFEESNRLLSRVIHQIDENYTECFYYMANNFAHIGEFDQAEQYALMYIQENQEGLYAEEAEELLDFICYELDRVPKELDVEHQLIAKHEKARHCLEEGKFVEATQLLEKMIVEYPTFLAARNNLALAYYYLGNHHKAIGVITEILAMDKGNLHALCNLAVFYTQMGREVEIEKLVQGLKKVYPYQLDHHYKLATTLGIVGEDDRALELFSVLAKRGVTQDTDLFHYAAVASFNTQRWETARAYWNRILEIKPMDESALYYSSLLDQPISLQGNPRLPYHSQLPYDIQLKKKGLASEGLVAKDLFKDPLVRSSMLWSLRHGDMQAKLRVIQSFAYIADQEIEATLRTLILDEGEEEYVKRIALVVLRQIGASPPYHAVIKGKHLAIYEDTLIDHFPAWMTTWQRVLDSLQSMMNTADMYTCTEQQEAQRLWTRYVSEGYGSLPVIRKAEGWAAAIEYMISVKWKKGYTKKMIAERYGISVQTLGKNVKHIERSILLDIESNSHYHDAKELDNRGGKKNE